MSTKTVQRKATDVVPGLIFKFQSKSNGLRMGKILRVEKFPRQGAVRIEYLDVNGFTSVLRVAWDARITIIE